MDMNAKPRDGQAKAVFTGASQPRGRTLCARMLFAPTVLVWGVLAVVGGLVSSPADAAPVGGNTIVITPVPDAHFFLQLQGDVTVPKGTRVVDADLFDVDADQVGQWRKAGIYPICYMSAGSYEDWRTDASQYPKSVLGKDYEGWAGEKWLDIRQIFRLAPIIKARLDLCRAKGFLGVDPDNIDGYLTDTGFKITRDDALRFVRWMAIEAHKRGLTIGQKNAPDMVRDLAGQLDFAVTESPVTYDHGAYFAPYVAQHKPVFAIEYLTAKADIEGFCRQAREMGFQGINAAPKLDGKNVYCNK
ncbi:endo alpha-1,4 polygalactosaminidase [Thalassospira mesophila]|uniref:endo alpha-1,4 polygalactosaminidase n=1 Tax=Thalassospira mesophila TaxID=1293891 RepID=UPI001302DC93|nr:endo alpha-1,4 polygalactosaminidase [Thalassospira mesophila]